MAHKADNDNKPGSGPGSDGASVIEIIATGFENRTDLFESALAARAVIQKARTQLTKLHSMRETASPAECRLIDQEMRGVTSTENKATRRFRALEEAMHPELRTKLWGLIDEEDGWK
jgi:hypothetical protein